MSRQKAFTLFTSSVIIVIYSLFWLQLSILYNNPLEILNINLTAFLPILYIALILTFLFSLTALLITLNIPLKETLIIYTAGSLTSLLFFKLNIFIIALSLGLTLSILYFDVISRRDLHNHIKIRPSQTFSRTFGSLITVIALTISFGYYPFTSQQIRDFELTIPEKVFQSTLNLFVNNLDLIPGVGPTKVGREVAEEAFGDEIPSIRKKLNELGVTDEKEIQRYLDDAREQFLKQYEQKESQITTEDPTMALLEPFKEQLEDRLNALVDLYRPYLPAIFAVSLFATLKILSTPIIIISLALLNLALWILKILGIVQIQKVQKECEVLSLQAP